MDNCLIMDLGVLKCKERQVASELDLYGTNYENKCTYTFQIHVQ